MISGADKSNGSKPLEVARRCLEGRFSADLPIACISEAFKTIGDKFENGVYHLPELIFAGTTAQKDLKVLGPILSSGEPDKTRDKVIIGTEKGHIHDLGKNIMSIARIAVVKLVCEVSDASGSALIMRVDCCSSREKHYDDA